MTADLDATHRKVSPAPSTITDVERHRETKLQGTQLRRSKDSVRTRTQKPKGSAGNRTERNRNRVTAHRDNIGLRLSSEERRLRPRTLAPSLDHGTGNLEGKGSQTRTRTTRGGDIRKERPAERGGMNQGEVKSLANKSTTEPEGPEATSPGLGDRSPEKEKGLVGIAKTGGAGEERGRRKGLSTQEKIDQQRFGAINNRNKDTLYAKLWIKFSSKKRDGEGTERRGKQRRPNATSRRGGRIIKALRARYRIEFNSMSNQKPLRVSKSTTWNSIAIWRPSISLSLAHGAWQGHHLAVGLPKSLRKALEAAQVAQEHTIRLLLGEGEVIPQEAHLTTGGRERTCVMAIQIEEQDLVEPCVLQTTVVTTRGQNSNISLTETQLLESSGSLNTESTALGREAEEHGHGIRASDTPQVRIEVSVDSLDQTPPTEHKQVPVPDHPAAYPEIKRTKQTVDQSLEEVESGGRERNLLPRIGGITDSDAAELNTTAATDAGQSSITLSGTENGTHDEGPGGSTQGQEPGAEPNGTPVIKALRSLKVSQALVLLVAGGDDHDPITLITRPPGGGTSGTLIREEHSAVAGGAQELTCLTTHSDESQRGGLCRSKREPENLKSNKSQVKRSQSGRKPETEQWEPGNCTNVKSSISGIRKKGTTAEERPKWAELDPRTNRNRVLKTKFQSKKRTGGREKTELGGTGEKTIGITKDLRNKFQLAKSKSQASRKSGERETRRATRATQTSMLNANKGKSKGRTVDPWSQGILKNRLSRMKLSSDVTSTTGDQTNWNDQLGNKPPAILTMVALELVSDEEKREATKARIAGLLGEPTDAGAHALTDAEDEYTGEILIHTAELSEQGIKLLNRGRWLSYKVEPDGEKVTRGLYMPKKFTLGTADAPRFTARNDNSIVFKWKLANSQKIKVYEAMKQAITNMFVGGAGLSDSDFVDSETGEESAKGKQGAVGKARYAAGWHAAQGASLHAHRPPFFIKGEGSNPNTLSHKGRDFKDIAQSEKNALRIRFPMAYYKEARDLVFSVAEELGTTLDPLSFPFPSHAIKDTEASLEASVPKKGNDKGGTGRALIKVISIATPTDPGLTHPAEVSEHLWRTAGVSYVGCGFSTQMVSTGGSPVAMAYIFGVLVDVPDPVAEKKLGNPQITWSEAVTIRKWEMGGDALTVKNNLLHLVEGRVAIQPSNLKKHSEAHESSFAELLTSESETAKSQGVRLGLASHTKIVEAETRKTATMKDRIVLLESNMVKRKLQRTLEEAEAREQESLLEDAREREAKTEAANARGEAEVVQPRPGEQVPLDCFFRTESTGEGHDTNWRIEEADVAEGLGSRRPSILDLVRYAVDNQVLGHNLGIRIEPVQERQVGTMVQVRVQVTVMLPDRHTREFVIGADPAAAMFKLADLPPGSSALIQATLALKRVEKAPKWLNIQLEAAVDSPSPLKKAKPSTVRGTTIQRAEQCCRHPVSSEPTPRGTSTVSWRMHEAMGSARWKTSQRRLTRKRMPFGKPSRKLHSSKKFNSWRRSTRPTQRRSLRPYGTKSWSSAAGWKQRQRTSTRFTQWALGRARQCSSAMQRRRSRGSLTSNKGRRGEKQYASRGQHKGRCTKRGPREGSHNKNKENKGQGHLFGQCLNLHPNTNRREKPCLKLHPADTSTCRARNTRTK